MHDYATPKPTMSTNVHKPGLRALRTSLKPYLDQGLSMDVLLGAVGLILQEDTKVYNKLSGAINAYMCENGISMDDM